MSVKEQIVLTTDILVLGCVVGFGLMGNAPMAIAGIGIYLFGQRTQAFEKDGK